MKINCPAEGVSLAERFIKAVENTIQLIAEFPFRFPVVYRERRRAGVRRFPYGLFFQVEAERILLIACFHGKRDPRLCKDDRPRAARVEIIVADVALDVPAWQTARPLGFWTQRTW